jgi:flagellar hook-length control protein FliK
VSGGVSAAVSAEGESALGFVDALLGMLTQSLGVGPQTGGETGTGTGTPADPQAPHLADIGLAVDAAIKGDLPADLPEDSEKLLGDLVAALAAIDDAAESGQPVDPVLHKKLSESLDEIAGMLGITLPAPPAIDPTLTAAAGTAVTAPAIEFAAGLTIESKPLPPGYELPVDGEAAAKPDTKLADDFLKAVEAVTTPVIEEEEKVKDKKAEGTAPTDDAEGTEPETRIDRLVAKLTEVAEKLAGRLPEVSAKLEALALKLSAKALDTEMMVKLEASLADGDIDALLAPKPEAGKPAAPAPSLFTAPTLPTPAVAAVPPKQSADAPKPAEPLAPAEPKLDRPEDKPVAKDTKPAERADSEPKVRDRGSFAAHLADARAEKQAAEAQQTQPAVATSVKTDMGVVTPKSVHAAYQVPVQQINMPQVAFEVVRQFSQGTSRFQIRLDPPELGRIDVRMQVDGDGNVHARMTVERAETLDLMQRDQRSLEKALAQAGLDSGKTSLEFSLRQNPFGRDGQGQQQGGHNPLLRDTRSGADEVPDIATTTQYRGTASASGVNLFV